jgi:hypothetical protein
MMIGGPASGSSYPHWAKCGLGSTVTTEDVKEIAPGMRMISTTSMTLAAVEKDKVVIDMVVRNHVEGGPVDFPPTETLQEVGIPAEPETRLGPEVSSTSVVESDGSWGMAEVTSVPWGAGIEEGEETIVVAGREIACRWIRRSLEVGGLRLTLKTWLSEEIPGGLARSEARMEGSPAQDSTTVVVSFLKK